VFARPPPPTERLPDTLRFAGANGTGVSVGAFGPIRISLNAALTIVSAGQIVISFCCPMRLVRGRG
jgi:hypothetical protein